MTSDLLGLSCQFDQFQPIDESLFNQMIELKPPTVETVKYNYCPDCNIPMTLAGSDYQCSECGSVQAVNGNSYKNFDDIVNGSLRITTGANKGRLYNVACGDYAKTQLRIILDQLMKNQSNFSGMAFPHNILFAAASQYNRIQKYITEDDIDDNGKVRGQKKFVRRGNIKDEVLAGLVYFEGIREKLVRKKRDIAMFMKLPTCGFSRGEDILRNLQAEDKIDIPVDEEPIEGYVDRYMDGLNLDNPDYTKFIIELVQESENKKIGMNSQLSSKIVGAIWILIDRCKLQITPIQLECAADNTKRNTFMKFYNIVVANIAIFSHIFIKNNIPLH